MVGGVKATSGSELAPRKGENEKHVERWWDINV